MKLIITCALTLLALAGCSVSANENLEWFKTKQDSIDYGKIEEKIKESDIIGDITLEGETFVVYKKQLGDGIGVGVSNITENNGKYAWYTPDQDVLVKNNSIEKYSSQISWVTNTQSGKSFTIYIGISEDESPIILTANSEEVSPTTIDRESGIYFYITPN